MNYGHRPNYHKLLLSIFIRLLRRYQRLGKKQNIKPNLLAMTVLPSDNLNVIAIRQPTERQSD